MAVAAEHKTRAVVLSDIHIGDNTPTCWYQRSVHEPYLIAILKWIIDRRDMVREVILLGDIFDTWTYPPAKVPPTMSQIAAEHPRLLGPSGAFADLVRAFPGGVKLLLGNHDGTLGRADMDELNKSLGGNIARGEAITFVDCPVLVLRAGSGGPRTAFTHGHHWCMFNAPDERSRGTGYRSVSSSLGPSPISTAGSCSPTMWPSSREWATPRIDTEQPFVGTSWSW